MALVTEEHQTIKLQPIVLPSISSPALEQLNVIKQIWALPNKREIIRPQTGKA